MIEVPVSELRVSDIGRLAITIDSAGNAYQGTVQTIRAVAWKYGKRPEEMVTTNIVLSSAEGSALELSNLPLDFRIQVDRGRTNESEH